MTEEKIEWLNGYWTKEDFKAAGVKTKRGKSWYTLRRWQVHRLSAYATQQEMPYDNYKELGLVV